MVMLFYNRTSTNPGESAMPDFELVPLDEAERNTQLVGKRGAPKRQYIGTLSDLKMGTRAN